MKRIISMLLAVTMLLGLFPGFAFAAEADGSFAVDFRTGDTSTMNTATRYPTYIATTKGDGWSVDSANSTIADGATGSYFATYTSFSTWGDADRYITLDFTVPEGGGAYDITAYGMHRPEGGYINYYIDGVYIGRFDCRASAADYVNATATALRPMELTGGTHKLTLSAQKSGGANAVMLPVQVEFTKTDELTKLSEASFTYDRTELLKDETASLTGELTFANGTSLDLRTAKFNTGNAPLDGSADTSITVSCESSDENVAAVAADGTVTGVGDGTADVSVCVEIGDVKLEKSFTFSVSKYPRITVDFATADKSTMNTTGRYPIFTNTTKGSNWAVDGTNSTCATGITSLVGVSTFDYIQIATADKTYLTVDFTVSGDGNYDVAVFGAHRVYGGIANFYIDGSYIGSYDCYDAGCANAGNLTTEALRPVELTSGTHKLTVELGGKSGGSHNYLYLQKFVLTGTEELTAITKVSPSIESTEFAEGKSAEITTSVAFENGVSIDLRKTKFNTGNAPLDGSADNSIKLTYSSSDENVATVSDDGVITTIKEGNTNITVTAEAGGKRTDSEPIAISVLREKIGAVSLTADKMYILLANTDGMATGISASYNTGRDVEMSQVSEIVYESSDESIATVDSNGVVKPVSLGEVVITAAVTLDGETASGSLALTISETPIYPSYKVDFQKQLVSTVYDATLENSGWQINQTMSDSKLCDGTSITRFQPYGLQIQSSLDEPTNHITFDFHMEETGTYDITFRGIQAAGGASAAYIYIDGKYIGEYNFYSAATVNPAYIAQLRSLELEEGTHTLTLVAKEKTGWGANMYPSYIEFKGTGELDGVKEIGAEMARRSIAAGESEEYTLYILQNNGAKYYARPSFDGTSEISLAMTSADDTVATVNGSFVKAIKPGTVKMLISGKLGDMDISDEFEFTVNDNTYDRAEIDVVHELFFVGGETEISASAVLSDGTEVNARDVSCYFTSDNEEVAAVTGNTLSTIAEGEANITAHVTFNGEEKTASAKIKVETVKLAAISAKTEDKIISVLDADGSKLIITGTNNDGTSGSLDGAVYTYESLTPEIVSVSEDGYVFSISRGTGRVRITANIGGLEFTCEAEAISSSQKTEPTLYTYEMRENALKNAEKHSWARSLAKGKAAKADEWVENLDVLYENLPGEGVPRSYTIATLNAPEAMMYYCPYCETDIRAEYGNYGWSINITGRPWKVQCPDCNRLFPSNDFELLHKRGLDENGVYNRDLAIENNRIAVANGEKDALVNELYRDVGKTLGIAEDKVDTWMVDDGYGWSPDDGTYGTKTLPKFCPLALYMHGTWYSSLQGESFATALEALRDAYLYTGDAKYGRAGAILIDRMADLYPYFSFEDYCLSYSNSHGGRYSGKIVGSIWQTGASRGLVNAYDAFYPMYEDSQVVAYLSKKAQEKGLKNPKTTPDMIRENIETGILREIIKDLKAGSALGNFGMHQMLAAQAAVALDCTEETNDVFNWIIAPGGTTSKSMTDPIHGGSYKVCVSNKGGEMVTRYINDVDRDGFGNEVGASYNNSWMTGSYDVAELIYRYGTENENLDLFANPKFVKMIYGMIELTLGNNYTYAGGDYGQTGGKGYATNSSYLIRAFNLLKDPQIAQNYYYVNGNQIGDPRVDIFTDNDNLKSEMEAAIDTYGERKMESNNLTGFGLAILRGGSVIKDLASSGVEQRYDTYLYYGRTSGHGHRDMLQLGIDAYGFNFTPDLGYPEETGTQPNRLQWVSNTLAHNTVAVDEDWQDAIYTGFPMHFDSTDRVKLVDAEASPYARAEIYRRTAVTVEASEKDVYTLDFFRVKGGDEHTYSFHTQSYMGYTTDDLNLVAQVDENGDFVGSYAGKDVPYGKDPNSPDAWTYKTVYPRGYTWLENVNRAENIEDGTFSVNFKQTDFKKQVSDSKGLNLKFTALNDWTPTGVGIATGHAPNVANNKAVPGLDYMLIHRKGTNLDTLFTSLIQPYKGEAYIESAESIALTVKEGNPGENDIAKAVKVKLKSGRCDYVVYATNNSVIYTLTDGDVSFDFRGFVGVYSVNDENQNIYAYVNDGDIIGETEGVAAYEGKIIDFTEGLSFDNRINVEFDGEVDTAELAGKYIYVDNSGAQNGAYKIIGAEQNGENVSLHLGDVSLIKSFKNTSDFSAGYIYNIEKGQNFTIPLSTVDDKAPVFDAVSDGLSTSAGSSITVKLNAVSPLGEDVTYIGTVMPRGASINAETGVVTWRPDASQVGEAGFLITARDDSGRESSRSFEVTVYGATTGSISNTGTSSGNGGGGGGGSSGGATTTTPSDTDNEDKTDGTSDGSENASGDASTTRFIDLGNHAWAAESINTLADDGIVKGTTYNTYSPTNNITRADYALLLVRAFNLTSDDTTNFDDVQSTDYFAAELAIARNTGIVNGIGDNKYAPRNTITRQDMMVIIYRALEKLGKLPDEIIDTFTEDYPDVADVAPYAREAVTALIDCGLVNGKSGRIAPRDYTTRAEVAVLLGRILDYVK